ncbi:MAG: glutamine-hydrolyzing GMP synthase, partial [Bacteroidia bacterium]|nr:glutamine-hydrolyzing GMP synthase [Bacteroidia bacterium]
MHQSLLIVDFGSQFTQLIARRIRELNVYCEIHPFNNLPKDLSSFKGVILSGGPSSVRDTDAPKIDTSKFRNKFPLLGICYGAQLLANQMGGEVSPSNKREYGRAHLQISNNENVLLKNVATASQVWMSHADTITSLNGEFEVLAGTEDIPVAAFQVKNETTFGLQFHPEVAHTLEGHNILKNFVYDVCGCDGDWTPGSFIDETVASLQEKLGNDKVILGLSGGVDSGVASVLLHKAIGKNLYCIFIDNGLLRKNEFEQVLDAYKHMGLQIIGVDAKQKFYDDLKGISDPEKKRKSIGKVFIDVFDEEAHKIEDVKWLAQGTIYPDIIESVSVKGPSATIKSHHNVGGLPERMKLKIVEPLNALFKDEVRRIGTALG